MTLFHGSPIKIKDIAMAGGTFFSEDFEVASGYGRFVYKLEVEDSFKGIFYRDSLNEHWISCTHIPFYRFEIIDTALSF